MRSIYELINLDGRRALITGAAGHIGYVAAETLAELGAEIAMLELERQSCRERANELQSKFGVSAIPIE